MKDASTTESKVSEETEQEVTEQVQSKRNPHRRLKVAFGLSYVVFAIGFVATLFLPWAQVSVGPSTYGFSTTVFSADFAIYGYELPGVITAVALLVGLAVIGLVATRLHVFLSVPLLLISAFWLLPSANKVVQKPVAVYQSPMEFVSQITTIGSGLHLITFLGWLLFGVLLATAAQAAYAYSKEAKKHLKEGERGPIRDITDRFITRYLEGKLARRPLDDKE